MIRLRTRCNLVSCTMAMALLSGCGTTEPAGDAGVIRVSITGEELAVEGIPFDPMPREGQPVLVDGWSVTFDRWLIVIRDIRLNEPGPDPAQQQVVGAEVARERGPWVVDLVRQESVELTTIRRRADGRPFDTRVRYAFSYDIAPADATARGMNLDAAGEEVLRQMVAGGHAQWVEGTATRAPDMTSPFDRYPTQVSFRFAWGGRTSQINCSNPDNGNNPETNRGVQPKQDGPQRAVITLHTEHLFYDALNVEAPTLRFDPIAARAVPGPQGARVTLDDLAGALIVKLTDRDGRDVPDRGNLPGYMRRPGALSYDPMGAAGVTTLRDFIIYSARSMAHLNGEGLCYIERR